MQEQNESTMVSKEEEGGSVALKSGQQVVKRGGVVVE